MGRRNKTELLNVWYTFNILQLIRARYLTNEKEIYYQIEKEIYYQIEKEIY
jgi:hypothetical protein